MLNFTSLIRRSAACNAGPLNIQDDRCVLEIITVLGGVAIGGEWNMCQLLLLVTGSSRVPLRSFSYFNTHQKNLKLKFIASNSGKVTSGSLMRRTIATALRSLNLLATVGWG